MSRKAGAIKPVPEFSRGGSGNTKGKNKPVDYRKINSNASTVANK